MDGERNYLYHSLGGETAVSEVNSLGLSLCASMQSSSVHTHTHTPNTRIFTHNTPLIFKNRIFTKDFTQHDKPCHINRDTIFRKGYQSKVGK